MTSTTSYFTKSLPKRGDITGSPNQAFNMNSTCKGYYDYILRGITAGKIAAIGTLSHESNNFIYLFAPQIHRNLGGKPLGIVGNTSNKMGKFSCVYIKLTDLKYFPNIKSTTTMDACLKHTEITPRDPEHLKFPKDFKGFTDPLRGTLLPVFFLIYSGQDIPQGSIASDKEKSALAKLGLGYGLWVETASKAIDKFGKIKIVMDAHSSIDNMTEEAFYKKHFYGHINETNSLFVAKGPRGAITTVQSDAYPMEAKAIKKIFLPAPQALPQQVPATASALTRQLSANIKKEVVAKTGIHNLRSLHICGKIDQASTTFGNLSYPTLSTGMEVILGRPCASRSSSLSDLLHQTLATAREQDLFSIKLTAISLFHVPKALTGHLLTGNYAIHEADSLNNKAQVVDPSTFLPQRNLALVNREANKDLHAHSENALDVLDNHKTKTSTSIAHIGTMQDMADFTSLCVNSDTVSMAMFSPKGPQPLYRQFLMMFITTVNNRDWVDRFAKTGGNMPNLHWHLYVFLERIFNKLAGFAKDFCNVNIISKERLITNINTRFLTRAQRIMRAFIDQINLAQSTNLSITICRNKIYKYKLNPFNNTKGGAKAAMRVMDNTRADNASSNETQQSHCAEVAKRDSAVTPKGGGKAQAAQHLKKARHSGEASDSAKRNVTDMGMFFLHKLDMKAVKIFPKDMSKTICANFTCKGRECTRVNCTFKHPRKVSKLKKETINAIGNHFLQKGIGWLNEWHFLRVRSELPGELKSLLGGKDGPSANKKTY
jgi:hypothetical protein